jgi:hypothetical protein
MELHQKIGFGLIVAAILLGIGFNVGKWFSEHIRHAELRTWKHIWEADVAPSIDRQHPDPYATSVDAYQNDPWAASEQHYGKWSNRAPIIKAVQTGPNPTLVMGAQYEYVDTIDTERPAYDSEVDTRIYMARQDQEMREYLRQLREH